MKTKAIGVLGTGTDKLIRKIGPMALIYSQGSGYVIYHCLWGGNWSSWDCVESFSHYYGDLSSALVGFFENIRLFGVIKSKK